MVLLPKVFVTNFPEREILQPLGEIYDRPEVECRTCSGAECLSLQRVQKCAAAAGDNLILFNHDCWREVARDKLLLAHFLLLPSYLQYKYYVFPNDFGIALLQMF